MLRPVLVAGALVWCMVAAARPAAAQPTVKLTAWQSDTSGTGVRFEALAPFVETEPLAMQDELADGAFEYALDTAKINWATECSCYRHYAVLVRSRATGVVTRHKFRALPSGSFDDQYAEVMLTIRDGASGGDTRIALPVASAPGLEPKPLLTIMRLRDRPESLSLGGVTQVRLTVKNPTKGVAVLIPSATVVRPESGELWAHVTASLDRALPLTLPPDATETLTLNIQPQTWRAIEESLVPTEADKPHTSLRVGLPYANPIFGNRTGSIELAVPIRFRPSILTLLLALAAGVGLGGLVPLLGSKSGRGRLTTWGRATATALVVAIILELVGIFLVANNSKFVLFGFNLDPWQTLPVLLLGIGNGLLGFEAAKKLKFIEDKKAGE